METFALICGCDYNGSWKVYQSCNDAKKFHDILTNVYKIRKRNIRTLYNNQFTRKNIIKELNIFAKKIK